MMNFLLGALSASLRLSVPVLLFPVFALAKAPAPEAVPAPAEPQKVRHGLMFVASAAAKDIEFADFTNRVDAVYDLGEFLSQRQDKCATHIAEERVMFRNRADRQRYCDRWLADPRRQLTSINVTGLRGAYSVMYMPGGGMILRDGEDSVPLNLSARAEVFSEAEIAHVMSVRIQNASTNIDIVLAYSKMGPFSAVFDLPSVLRTLARRGDRTAQLALDILAGR